VRAQGSAPVRAFARSPAHVQHDFAAAGVCHAVLRLSLRSCLPGAACVSVVAGAGGEGGAGSLPPDPSDGARWGGRGA